MRLVECVLIPKILLPGVIVNGPEAVVGAEGEESMVPFGLTNTRPEMVAGVLQLQVPEGWLAYFGDALLLMDRGFRNEKRIETNFLLPAYSSKMLGVVVRFPTPARKQAAFRVYIKPSDKDRGLENGTPAPQALRDAPASANGVAVPVTTEKVAQDG
tara:strand:+ start:230 stop:700 length:471 start_codon:yes stop_codon:yes gene_type:complete